MMLNVDDYLNANLSFRKSYDLEQVFSFIKEGQNGTVPGGQLSFGLGLSHSKSNDEGENRAKMKEKNDGKKIDKDGKLFNNNDALPTIHNLRSQSMGLTPINSFSGDHKNSNDGTSALVPLNSMDGMALRAFFSSSPNTTGDSAKGGPTPGDRGGHHPSHSPMGPPRGTPKIGSPGGRYGGGSGTASAPVVHASTPPAVHASTPPSYGHRGPSGAGPRYDPPPGVVGPPPGNGGYAPAIAAAGTPPHGPSTGKFHPRARGGPPGPPGRPPPPMGARGPPGPPIGPGFPNKRIKLSSRHSLHPMVDSSKRTDGDFFVLLRKLAPCFGSFRFKLPEMETEEGVGKGEDATPGDAAVPRTPPPPHDRPGRYMQHPAAPLFPDEVTTMVAKRRISSSLCAFGGSLPPRTVSPAPSTDNVDAVSKAGQKIPNNANNANNAVVALVESPQEQEERRQYAESLGSRYFMKERCISWDVELHEVIAPQVRCAVVTKKGRSVTSTSTPKAKKSKKALPTTAQGGGGKYHAPVTPHTPGAPPTPGASPGTPKPNATAPPSTPTQKGSKIKYRCKLCGQPKQNHTCPYRSMLVRSIGTMVYPAVNAFVSNEPGRLAPPLSEMNNFTSLLSQDTSSVATGTLSRAPSGLNRGPSFASGTLGPYRHMLPPHARQGVGGPYNLGGGPPRNLLTPDTSHWSPNTPGGLSTMSSCGGDANSPDAPAHSKQGLPNVSSPHPHGGNSTSMRNKRDHHHLMMSRSMLSRTMSGPVPPNVGPTLSMPFPPPSMHPAPAGAIPSDVLFRDTMAMQKEQLRAVRSAAIPGVVVSTSAAGMSNAENGIDASCDATQGPNAYRYPSIPTPYTQRKEMGDTLFALSREVPKLADSCAAILREARENDMWDQAVAELTTQVLVVLKCEERDYTLEGLRRHLLTLGIAC